MALTAPVAEEYLAARGAAGYTAYLTPKALAPLLGYLRELGVVPGAEIAVPATQAEALLERYRRYLLAERGLREKVARGYVDSVRPFVASCAAARGADLRWLTAGDVTAFLTGKPRRLAPKTAQRLYLDLRRGLGFKLDRGAKLLDQFITCLEQRGTGTVTVTDALAWATLPANASPGWPMRMTVVRGFAAYLATLDLPAEVPLASLLPGGTRRAVPYLYSAADIAALLTQAGRRRRRCVRRRSRR